MGTIRHYQPVVQTYIKDCRESNIEVCPDAIANPPGQGEGVRYAIAQGPSMVPGSGEPIEKAIEFNFQTLETACKIASQYKVQLITFPELFLTGYQFPEGPEVPRAAAEFINSECYHQKIQNIANTRAMNVVCPMPYSGEDPAGNQGVYDVAMIFKPNEAPPTDIREKIQFKLHLWGAEEKDWFQVPKYPETISDDNNYQNYTNSFRVHLFNGFPVGIGICYDAEFPEMARCFALNGSLLTVFPTAAPLSKPVRENPEAEIYLNYPNISQHHIPAAALANLNFCSYSNRAGWEYNTYGEKVLSYDGKSIICNPYGKAMVAAVANEDCLLIADCLGRDIINPQPDDTYYLINRRPEIYTVLTQKEKVPFPYEHQHTYPS